MRKIILAASTLGVLAMGGVVNANAQTYMETAQPYGYQSGPVVYEGRNTYVGPERPTYYYDGITNRDQAYNTQWTQPGDAAILNQERANERSRR
ncbi:hypothetical protein MWN34_01925 [Ancylobacter sp. 6x-1]|uniref:Uncharacterized protein n=1 Tax=Ancylobacter crimeensis TaxID=2579147 RepID=A0ABT0D6T7_9HYPH|nr:hypothetical protein [Ancylobacter crimeensis]MCK0195661.1 hypothetical protein [Ancylobacter crimeensis]